MLICPLCEFENPNNNKFCQRCGTSLSHKTCPECSTQVPINAETCHNCGTFTGTVWWAIISKESVVLPATQVLLSEESPSPETSSDQAEESPISVVANHDDSPLQSEISTNTSSEPPLVEDTTDIQTTEEAADTQTTEEAAEEETTQPLSSPRRSSFPEESGDNLKSAVAASALPLVYLDVEERYRLLEPHSLEEITAAQTTLSGTSARVLDSQPFQKSLLEAIRDQQLGEDNHDSQESEKPENLNSEAWKTLGIPASAQAYLSLHQSYYPTLPEVHDAWVRDGVAVILLEDRSKWQILGNLWGSEELSTLQILYWLDEMAKLWDALEPWHCRQSLLEITNLRVDEDQALGLLRLYPESPEKELTLQDLGVMWQKLFSQSQRTQFASLGAVYRQLCTKEITTVTELRSRLEAIARCNQPSDLFEQPSASTEASEFNSDFAAIGSGGIEVSPTVMQKFSVNEANLNNDADDLPTVILPMQLLSLDDAGCTDIGHLREHNEDCFGIHTQIKKQENPMGRAVQARGLYVLCDGMGGHAAGEVASAMAVDKLKRFFQDNWQDEQLPSEETVREAVRVANQAIYDVNQQNARSGSGRMGTTLVMILIQNTEAVIAHVGDSRLYRLTRKRGLEQVTVDHEVGQREIKRGVEAAIAYSRPDAYQLTQALGPRNEQFISPDVQFVELNEDSLFVLCSDGLSDNDLIETHWQTHLAPLLSSRANLDQGILQLIELANEHNGHDNITAVLIRVKVRPNFEQQLL
jgi:protein phosphatase